MKLGVLGTGTVGRTIATKLVDLGHEVTMGSRTADNEDAAEWAASAEQAAEHGTFADAASFGELIVNCTAGAGSLDALRAAGEEKLAGKVLLDVANPLDFSQGGGRRACWCRTPTASASRSSAHSRTRGWSRRSTP